MNNGKKVGDNAPTSRNQPFRIAWATSCIFSPTLCIVLDAFLIIRREPAPLLIKSPTAPATAMALTSPVAAINAFVISFPSPEIVISRVVCLKTVSPYKKSAVIL